MEKNRKAKIIILILVTNMLTLGISSMLVTKSDNRVIIPVSDYEELKTVYEKYSKVEYIENIINRDYYKKPNNEELLEGELKGMVNALGDPYSAYLTKDEYEEITEDTSGEFGGIGVIIVPGEDNLITVVSPIEGTPGEKAGIKSEDKIIKINGDEFLAEEINAAVREMKGRPGTEVDVTILRKDASGKNEYKDLKIKREIIKVESVESSVIDKDIGYIKIKSFDEPTHDDFKKALNDLEKNKKVKGLIIDLRSNPGGLLDSTAAIADDLLDAGDVVYTQDRHGKKEYLKSKDGKSDLPLVVLVNGGSASASEILAGAIKDRGRGKLVGEQTFGKGLVQSIMPLPDGTGLKLTIMEYFTPNGVNIHGIGLKPDYEVKLPEDIQGIGVEFMEKDTQLQKAIEVLNTEIK